MKAVIIAVVCGAVAFATLFYFMQPAVPKADSVPVVSELPTTKPAPPAEEEPSPTPSPRTSKGSTAQKPKQPQMQPWKPDPKPAAPVKKMYYTTVPTGKGGPVPSKVIIHKTQVGDVTIVILDADDLDGRLLVRRGTTTGDQQQKYAWEIQMYEGNLTVYWNAEVVPPAGF
jgi:hypothetical protein